MMSLPELYPLRFAPLFKRYLWGGRRLAALLGKPLGPETDYAESWEVADHAQGQSVVASGPLAGATLHELVAARGPELLGRHAPQPRFPLIFKFLDCNRDLSVQVHPDDAAAALLTPPDLGKTEAWVILAAEPGSRVYAGLKRGVDRPHLEQRLAAGRTAECLASFEPVPGQCIFIPAGTVHALGAGLVVAEIQQASDTTYRLFDWNRVGPDGQPRKLHIAEALPVIDYAAQEVQPQTPQRGPAEHIERLVACDKFVLDRWTLARPAPMGGDRRFHLVAVLAGRVQMRTQVARPGGKPDDVTRLSLAAGHTVLVPASLAPVELRPAERAVLLDMYLP
jgi:mannose-6-phosphate isomerase